MDWLYKARAVIGMATLIAAVLYYHHAATSVYTSLQPDVTRDTQAIVLTLLSVIPATGAVVLFTKRGRRGEAFRQMVRYPVKTALICLAMYGVLLCTGALLRIDNLVINLTFTAIYCLIFLRYVLFPFRAIYLLAVGMCRLGDGHPLLPPVLGPIFAWAVACQSLLSGNTETGALGATSLAILLCGPTSITILGCVEIARLRVRYPQEFPFRKGPLSFWSDYAPTGGGDQSLAVMFTARLKRLRPAGPAGTQSHRPDVFLRKRRPRGESDPSATHTSSGSASQLNHLSLFKAFTDGIGSTFDIFGGIERERSHPPSFDDSLAQDAQELCHALGLTPYGSIDSDEETSQ
jgi:hypothetical protein